MKNIDKLFEENNQHKFSYVLIVKDNIDHNTFVTLSDELKNKVNVVSIKRSMLSKDEITYALEKSNFVITGIGETLELVEQLKKPALIDASINNVSKSYPDFIDFFDPHRNEKTKPYYTNKDLKLFVQEVFNQLDKHKIDYVNFM